MHCSTHGLVYKKIPSSILRLNKIELFEYVSKILTASLHQYHARKLSLPLSVWYLFFMFWNLNSLGVPACADTFTGYQKILLAHAGRAIRSNLLLVPHKRISTSIPNAVRTEIPDVTPHQII